VTKRLLVSACAWLLTACVTPEHSEFPRGIRPPVELLLSRADGTRFQLSSLRDRPTLLFLFATYDTASQLALGHLERFLAREPRISVLGVALQPDANAFLDPYRDALSVDFPLSYDPGNTVLRGTSELGLITSVPAFIAIDTLGRVSATRYGVATPDELGELVEPLLSP